MKQKIIPLISIVIGVIAFVLTSQYLRGKQHQLDEEIAKLKAGARQVSVVAAAQDIPGGTVIKMADMGRVSVAESAITDRMIPEDQYKLVEGRRTALPIKALQPILWQDLEGGSPIDQGLSSIVTHGMRALSLAVGGPEAVSGMIEPNDRIDVLGTFSFPSKKAAGEMETVTLTVLQDVTVLAVGQKLANRRSSDRSAGGGARTITVEVTPREAELLVFAQQVKGGLTLTLRNPSDVSFEPELPEINFSHLESKLPELNTYRQKNIRHKKNL